jgi:hypothetical protein
MMYELREAMLGDVKGRGYAFKQKTAFGKARRGIFFPDDEEDLEKITDGETLEFSGALYYGKREREKSFAVQIVETTPTRMGERVDFEAVDNPEPVRQAG